MIKIGDVVEVLQTSSWGGIRRTGETGLVVRRLYQGYERKYSKWEVMMSDSSVLTVQGSQLSVVTRATCG
jgi:hypothetical protein